jgi:hypothetical protein
VRGVEVFKRAAGMNDLLLLEKSKNKREKPDLILKWFR